MSDDKALVTQQEKAPTIAKLLAAKQKQIAAVLPKHLTAERLLRIAVTEINRTPALAECTPQSLVASVITSAQLGLETGGPLGRAYLVPFRVKRKDAQGRERWVREAQLIIGYRGMIDLARRTGSVATVQAQPVYKNDEFEYEYGLNDRLRHKPAEGERGEFRCAWCLVRFKDGSYQFTVMTKAEIDRIMRSTQSKGEYGPWKDHYDQQATKTTIRRIFKFLPVSIEDQMVRAMEMDDAAEAGTPQTLPVGLDFDDDWASPTASGPMPLPQTAASPAGEILEGEVEPTTSQTPPEPASGQPGAQEDAEAEPDPEEVLRADLAACESLAELKGYAKQVNGFPDTNGQIRLRAYYQERRAALEAAEKGGA